MELGDQSPLHGSDQVPGQGWVCHLQEAMVGVHSWIPFPEVSAVWDMSGSSASWEQSSI